MVGKDGMIEGNIFPKKMPRPVKKEEEAPKAEEVAPVAEAAAEVAAPSEAPKAE